MVLVGYQEVVIFACPLFYCGVGVRESYDKAQSLVSSCYKYRCFLESL